MNKLYSLIGKNYTFTIIRRIILIFLDLFLIIVSIKFSGFLLNINLKTLFIENNWYLIIALLIGLTIYILTGQYSGLTRYQPRNFIYNIFLRNIIFITIIFYLSRLIGFNDFKKPFFIFSCTFLILTTYTLRAILRDILIK